VSGFVPDVTVHYRASRMMIVPLRHGGGTRLKILEALARGLPVVTTSAGCAGLGLSDSEVMIADSPAEFAAAIDRLVDDDELWSRLSAAGRRFVEQHYDWTAIGRTLASVMDDLHAERRDARPSAAGSPIIKPSERQASSSTEAES
jgi:glycosyltransferase involved in cell wall biosynthesis